MFLIVKIRIYPYLWRLKKNTKRSGLIKNAHLNVQKQNAHILFPMNKLYIFIAILVFPLSVFATPQTGDILIWNGDTLDLRSNPLKFREDHDLLRTQIFKEVEKQTIATFSNKDNLWLLTSTCWRGYQAEWIVQNDSIFLNNIYHCFFDEVKINLNNIFPNNRENEKIFASWINGELFVPRGNCIPRNDCIVYGFGWDFRNFLREYETVLFVENGLLKSYETFQNRIVKNLDWVVFDEQDRIVSNNINWENLPSLSDGRYVHFFIDVQPNEQGLIESINKENILLFDSHSNDMFNTDMNCAFIQEGIRIAKMMPEWTVILQRGKILPTGFSINFTSEYRRRF